MKNGNKSFSRASNVFVFFVMQGLMELLDNHLSHPLLKKLLPLLTNMFHDTSDRVRIAATNLLLKVKGIRSIKVNTSCGFKFILKLDSWRYTFTFNL